jgi:hypothetical protein
MYHFFEDFVTPPTHGIHIHLIMCSGLSAENCCRLALYRRWFAVLSVCRSATPLSVTANPADISISAKFKWL